MLDSYLIFPKMTSLSQIQSLEFDNFKVKQSNEDFLSSYNELVESANETHSTLTNVEIKIFNLPRLTSNFEFLNHV